MDGSKILVKGKFGIRKIIVLGLVVISFVMLFFPWITMSIQVMGEKYTMQDIMSLVYAESGTTQSYLEEEMRESFTDMAQEAAQEGIQMDVDKMMDLLRMCLEGKISPIECATASAFLSSLLGDIVDAANNSADAADLILVAKQIEGTKKSMATATIGMWGILVLMTVGVIYAIYSLLADKKYGVMAYAGVSVVAFAAFAIAANKLNSSMLSVFGGIYDIFEDMGLLGSASVADLDMFHLSAAPYICMIAGIASVVIEKVQLSGNGVPVISVSATKWICTCGASNDDKNQFCCVCGQKRQGKKTCICGAEWKPGAMFCSGCGRKLDGAADPVPVPRPVPKPNPVPNPVPAPTPLPDPMPEKKDSPWRDMGDLI